MTTRQALWAAAFLAFLNIHAPAATLYVNLNSTNPAPPYASWNTAATNIQDAIEASSADDLILVTNGVYATGGRTANGYALTNRVVIDKVVTVQSVNGPTATFIQGHQMPGTLNGSNAVRCVWMAKGATLSGFTVTGGATSNLIDVLSPQDESGGGLWCASSNAVISNCVIVANSCYWFGAGVYSGTLVKCQVLDNTNLNGSPAGGGGAAFSTLLDSDIKGNWARSYGGGVWSCALSNCTVTANSGGGAYGSTLEDCTLSNNISSYFGGGAQLSTLNHCVLCNNRSQEGGGAYDCVLNFCVVSNNLSDGYGGGIYYDLHQTNAIGQGNIVVGNVATNFSIGAGGGVYIQISANVTDLTDWTFISNSAAGDGGGLEGGGGVTLSNCVFIGNSSGGSGGGFNHADAFNCTLIGNVAAGNGGGAYSGALTNCYVSWKQSWQRRRSVWNC